MIFHDWTSKSVELRLIEAMETHMLLPRVHGPREYGNAMPEIVREKWKDAAPSPTRFRKRLEPGAISRMEECWDWLAAILTEADRFFIDEWARMKVGKGRRLNEMSGENSTIAKSINRRKNRVCSVIANELNRKHLVRLNGPDCELSENRASITTSKVSSEKRDHGPAHWRPSDAVPHSDPGLPSERLLDPRAIRARHSNQNRSLSAGK